MKFNVPSKALYAFVSAVAKVINAKNAMTILNNFLFSLEGNRLQVVACDMENTLVGYIDVMDAEGEGRFCLDAQCIISLLKEIPDQGIEFNIDNDTLAVEITYSMGEYNLMATSSEEYPYDPTKEPSETEAIVDFDAPADSLLRAIDVTIFATSREELRPQMCGVYWDIHNDDITFVATDTKQLVKYVDGNIKTGVTTSFVLPSKPCQVLKNVFTSGGDVKVTIYDKCAVFENSQFNFTCSLLKGRYPDYNRVIPQTSAYTLTLDCNEFLQALKRVSIFSGGQGLVKFKITPELIKMRTDAESAGNAHEQVKCDFSGNEMLIGFSWKVLMEMFQVIKSEEGVIKLTDPGRPGLILPMENEEGTQLTMLLMPMSVNNFPED